MRVLSCDTVKKSFGENPVLRGVSFDLAEHEFVCLLGPSGCGKTTLLRIIAGLEALDDGQVTLNDAAVSARGLLVPPQERGIGLVFQDVALFPNMTVSQNIAFGLQGSVKTHSRRIDELLELINLEGYQNRYPFEISGGQQQRVALARALAPSPRLIMLDEPFSSLDAQLRTQVRDELHRVLRDAGVSAILVTHDQSEAFGFADRVLVICDGCVVQEGTPEDIYHAPASPWIAGFVGVSNFLTVEALQALASDPTALSGVNPNAKILVRPEDISIALRDGTDHNAIIDQPRFAGDHVDLVAHLASCKTPLHLIANHHTKWQAGQTVELKVTRFRAFSEE
ncbi:MAG: ABC transporter ATP-binding protein [Pseudomonadota bacterium]